jgi:hypothetical protein
LMTSEGDRSSWALDASVLMLRATMVGGAIAVTPPNVPAIRP